ncbi:NK-tumor recognition protein isoform X2 [Amia ocellicauda]|uniref:NK-tumor recognition protein isoform X2 n=1 Tax=Amia ocellicauda TaxID=2972642 RepID=UPI0034642553
MMGVKDRPQCYFDVEINRDPVGRIVFQLFSDICPKTSKNFLCLCTGEKGTGKSTGKKLCYKGSTFHRIVKSFMIQGGDFTEGNGRGGESIYGGYFKDENFVLKHDRAFLLSMANRGKDTNGSQFFITTKTAPHLDGVHVVFGLIISGFEVIKQIENLKTDSASRPYADVRVIDCGQLITKSANDVLGCKRKLLSCSSDSSVSSLDTLSLSSTSESDSDSEEKYRRRKRKRPAKSRHAKRRRKEGKGKENNQRPSSSQRKPEVVEDEKEKDLNVKRDKPVVRPEEIPPVPENRFLLRRDVPIQVAEPEQTKQVISSITKDLKPAVTKSGRKIKGRGTMRYHTPTQSRSRSKSEDDRGSSETPPHWKEEMQRTKTYKPPSGEKWSKGDKLNDHHSSRWKDRSASPWSRSWSHEYFSDRSSERSSEHRTPRKEKKKTKHKKKSKKQKHSKRSKRLKSKAKDSPLSEDGSSLSSSRRSKISSNHERRSRSLSTSSRHSSRKDWTGSDKKHRSSPSSKGSRSYTRSKSRSRSYSRSRSRNHSRSRSRSSSRSGSLSRSRSRSHRSTSSRSSRNTPINESNKAKADASRPATVTNEKAAPPAATESAPVLPISDSPPPSRWKPGQKPWKPSYVRIQEIKAKTVPTPLAQTSLKTKSVKEKDRISSHCSQYRNSDSERSKDSRNYSDRSYEYKRRSHSRSSRSRSYSRSYSRSQSRSRSSSRSGSREKYESRSSSYSRSDSYNSYDDEKNKKSSSVWRKLYNKRQESSPEATVEDKHVANSRKSSLKKDSRSLSSSEYSTDSENSQVERSKKDDTDSKRQKSKTDSPSETDSVHPADPKLDEPSVDQALAVEGKKSKSGWDSDSDNSRKKVTNKDQSSAAQQPDPSRMEEKSENSKAFPISKWDSESDSEGVAKKSNADDSKRSSSKEEGEASSETESEGQISLHSKTSRVSVNASPADSDAHIMTAVQTEHFPVAEVSEVVVVSEKHKSRKKAKRKHKHKKRSSAKSEERAKSKSKSKKSKKKHQKPKETFHWQPPLEFGEEEEEEQQSQKKQGSLKKGVLKETPLKPIRRRTLSKCEDNEVIVITEESQKLPKEKCSSQADAHSVKDITERTKPGHQSKQSSVSGTSPNKKETTDLITTRTNYVNTNNKPLPKSPDQPEPSDDSMEICTPEHHTPDRNDFYGITEISETISHSKESPLGISKDAFRLTPVDHSKVSSSTLLVNNCSGEENARTEVSVAVTDPKWKPLKGISNQQPVGIRNFEVKSIDTSDPGENKPQGLRIEIKSKSRVRPGSLFDEVRKTARLNQRPRNQESSSEERSPSVEDKGKSRSRTRSHSKSRSVSSLRTRSRTRSLSYSRSRTRSRSSSYSYRSRSYSRSRSRRRYSRGRSRTRSSTYRSYRSRSRTYSRSHSRSRSYDRQRRSRSYSYDSYYSRSRSRSSRRRSDSYRKSRSYDRRSRSYRSYSRSDRSYSRRRSHSGSSRYS